MSAQPPLAVSASGAEIKEYIDQFVSGNGDRPHASLEWPKPIGQAAYHGVIGEAVRAIEPHTEADVNPLLMQIPVMVGTMIGRGPHFTAGGGRHAANLYVLIVGSTADGAKGMSTEGAEFICTNALPELRDRIDYGLSSGEGLVHRVRDALYERRSAKKDEEGDHDNMVEVLKDPGIDDKRLLMIETEFSSVLIRKSRQGSTMAEALQQGWDGKTLGNLVRNNPEKATGAHISAIGHTTPSALKAHLASLDHEGGLTNRILWACSRYSKDLPEGGAMEDVDWTPIHHRLVDAVSWARSGRVAKVGFADDALEMWKGIYHELRGQGAGLLGAITARGRPQVRKLAMIYALLDREDEIGLPHLRAALEIWRYSVDSCRYLLGELTGDPLADEILAMLREAGTEGMTRTEIRDAFARHKDSLRISTALGLLTKLGLAHMKREKTSGRKAERWFARERS